MLREDEIRWCYDVLEVSMGASWEEIRHAYRSLAQRYHPDRQLEAGKDARSSERFKDISRAFRLLSDYVKENGLPPQAAIHRQHPAPDPAVNTGKVYSTWQESLHRQAPRGKRSQGVSLARKQRYKFAAFVGIPILIVYLVISLNGAEDEYAADAQWSEDVYTPPAVRTDIPSYIRVGLDKEAVELIQGEPTRRRGNVWYYGESKIFFEKDHVAGWEMDLSYPLRVDLGERSRPTVPRFTYGASTLEVEAIQGTPTSKDEGVWTYGLSKVYFKNGLVVRWDNDPRTPLLVYD